MRARGRSALFGSVTANGLLSSDPWTAVGSGKLKPAGFQSLSGCILGILVE